MDIILLEKVRNLGNMGQTVHVKNGYGRNYLLPKKLAVLATPTNVEMFKARRAELEKAALATLQAAQKRAETLSGQQITVTANAGSEGKLYGSLGARDIAEAISAALPVSVERSEVVLSAGPIRTTGEHEIVLQLHSDVNCTVKIVVVAE